MADLSGVWFDLCRKEKKVGDLYGKNSVLDFGRSRGFEYDWGALKKFKIKKKN